MKILITGVAGLIGSRMADWIIDNYGDLIIGNGKEYPITRRIKESNSKEDQKVYQSWVKIIGGEKNVFLRDFLKNFRLA